jgi:peptidoglycan/LPS O-acetylase OafA/YrhL
MNDRQDTTPARRWRRAAPLLLILPYIGTLWVSSYASIEPTLWGIPFFYWYQFLWVAIGVAITVVVYTVEESSEESAGATPDRHK